MLNSLNRSIGMPDSYPFKLSTPVLEKLEFVHRVVRKRKPANLKREDLKPTDIKAAMPTVPPLPASGAAPTPVQTG